MDNNEYKKFINMDTKEQALDLINSANMKIKEYEERIEVLKKSIEVVSLMEKLRNKKGE